jgi:uncharacterized protein YndB with AHSA1/START domain
MKPNMMLNSEVQKPDNATLVLRRLLKAPPERAFKAWTSPEHIQHWMKPEPGMVVPLVRMDLRVGGKFRIQMKNPDGEYFTAAGEFREVQPPERLVYTWDWETNGSGEDFGELEGKTSLITVEFLRRGEQTEFLMTHTLFATVESRDNHARGWTTALESFAEFVEQ